MKVKMLVVLFALFVLSTLNVMADEGMWTFDNPPVKQLQENYGFTPDQDWLDHVRLASVRFMDGGSGSFISSNGLVLTNHHVAMGQLQKLSTAEHNLVEKGFYAPGLADEKKCPDLEVNVLVDMIDVTEKVSSAITDDMNEADALKSRRAKIASIENESLKNTGLRSNVVSLYHGGEYWLYRYKKYTDVRLVMAPERLAAFFGGDNDNFTYPRYDLDMAFFRVYENGEPLKSEHYFAWNSQGADEGELIFVSGNPGSTDRLLTYEELLVLRDHRHPIVLQYLDGRINALREYAAQGEEQQRRALGQIFGLENAKKAYTGELKGLQKDELMASKKSSQDAFEKRISADESLNEEYGDLFGTVAAISVKSAKTSKRRFFHQLRGSRMANYAKNIVRYVVEVQQPDAERLEGYHESDLAELRFRLFSPAPIYKDLEAAVLASTLELALQNLGEDDEFLESVLKGRTPKAAAEALINGSQLDNSEFRKALVDGGVEAVRKSDDTLISLLWMIDPLLRKEEKWHRENIQSVLDDAREKIARARFAVYGKSTFPDATFTLRLSYGTPKSYPMNGTMAPYKTTLYGLYDRSLSFNQKGDYQLPQRFWDRLGKLDLSTPVNFACTCETVGGNSGSPVINTKKEIVGLIFDGNIESLAAAFVYDEEVHRSIAVHTAYMMEALRVLYDAQELADEIEGK